MATKKGRTRTRSTSKTRSTQYEQDIEKLVRAGVERFILEDATMYDFMKTLRSASDKSLSAHPLTKAVFSRIVKDAIKKRKKQKRGS